MSQLPEILQDRGTDLDRIKAFSDGVFSIAITLLVLGLQVPKSSPNGSGGLGQALGQIALPLTSYVVSFMMIGLYWIIHCRLFRYLKSHNRGLAMYNLVFLFFVSLVPFTTPLVYAYRKDPLAWCLYFGNLAFMAFGAAFVWWQALRHDFVHEDTPAILRQYIFVRSLIPGVVFAITSALVFINFQVAAVFPVSTALFMVIVNRRFTRLVTAKS